MAGVGSVHIGKAFDRFGKIGDGLVSVAMFNAVPDTMLDVSFQHHLTGFVQRRFSRVDLGQHILARHVLIDHPVDRLNLADNFF